MMLEARRGEVELKTSVRKGFAAFALTPTF